MNELIRKVIKLRPVWSILDITLGTSSRIFSKFLNAKNFDDAEAHRDVTFQNKCCELFAEKTVLHGSFQGMKYPSLQAFGSGIYPKILGSYEQELADVISYITAQKYTSIVDIGCAEGYYAVGFGMRMQNSIIYALDTNNEALDACKKMAELNNVTVKTGGFCDKDRLVGLDLGERALIFCDCEGYETDLIDSKVAQTLKSHDFLIETHDFLRIDITQIISEALSKTHDCKIVESIDDILKAYTYEFDELAAFDLDERRRILAESRPRIMRWIFGRSKEQKAEQEMGNNG